MATSTVPTQNTVTTQETNAAAIPGQTTSKEVGWYTKEFPELDADVYDLLEKYSYIKAEDIKSHILKCVGSKK